MSVISMKEGWAPALVCGYMRNMKDNSQHWTVISAGTRRSHAVTEQFFNYPPVSAWKFSIIRQLFNHLVNTETAGLASERTVESPGESLHITTVLSDE